jgi:DNA-binding NtrC family response regulator
VAATVLIVDDEPDLVDTLRRVLERAEYRVDVALDARAALARIRTAEPDVILSDFKMPGMGVSELYAELAERHPRLCRGFVLMAGDPTNEPVRTFVDRARVRCLAKPFTVAVVLETVAAAAEAASRHPGAEPAGEAGAADPKPRARGTGA